MKRVNGSPKKPYREFLDTFSSLMAISKVEELPKIIVIYGSCEYLKSKALSSFRKKWQTYIGHIVDSSSVTTDKLIALFESTPLFEQRSLGLITKAEKRADLWKLLADGVHLNDGNIVAMAYEDSAIQARHAEILKKCQALLIPCKEPAEDELPSFISGLARKQKLGLDQAACELIKETIGSDLTKLENEISKLALIFTEEQKVGANDISPFLGVLREDHMFKVESLIITKQKARALVLLLDLLRRGESPLAVLGLLAAHCRKALKIKDLCESGCPTSQLGEKLRLPHHVIKGYTNYIAGVNKTTFIQALRQCSEVDVKLKTSRCNADLALSSILFMLPN
jgi:DNA polymerase III delta subunit